MAAAFQFASEYFIRKLQKNQVDLELSGTYKLLFYADDINLLGHSISTVKENIEALLKTSRNIGLERNVEETKYMIMSRHPN
jgi:hypothetical protein